MAFRKHISTRCRLRHQRFIRHCACTQPGSAKRGRGSVSLGCNEDGFMGYAGWSLRYTLVFVAVPTTRVIRRGFRGLFLSTCGTLSPFLGVSVALSTCVELITSTVLAGGCSAGLIDATIFLCERRTRRCDNERKENGTGEHTFHSTFHELPRCVFPRPFPNG